MPPTRFRFLDRRQTRVLKGLALFSVFVLANSLYLTVASHTADHSESDHPLPWTYQLMLVGHVLSASILVLGAIAFAAWHLKKALYQPMRGSVASGIGVAALLLLLSATGLLILTEANSQANRTAFVLHQVGALLLPALYLVHRLRSKSAPDARTIGRVLVTTGALTLLMGAAHAWETLGRRPIEDAPRERAPLDPAIASQLPFADPFLPFHPIAEPPASSPFAPSLASTRTGGLAHPDHFMQGEAPPKDALHAEVTARGFAMDSQIGAERCAECHQDIVAQWASSAHRFSSFNNPFYAKAFELTLKDHGPERTQWCAGCHDPTLLFSGALTSAFDRKGAMAQTGLSCTSCHLIDELHGTAGNAGYRINDRAQSPYLFGDAKSGPLALINEYLIKARPDAHRAQMKKPFFETSEYCAACHKVSFHEFINDYRWLRGQNEYDAWHDSGVAHNNPMTFYEPKTSRVCQDCHMPEEAAPLGDVSARNGMVKSHRFSAANTALPHLRSDATQLDHVEHFLQKDRIDLKIFGLRSEDGVKALAIDDHPGQVRPGERVQIDLVVRNKDVGHTFPGGTNDSNEGWIDFEVLRANGQPIWRHGALQADGHVEPRAHFYRAVLIDQHAQHIDRRNVFDIRTPIYANVIPPGTADIPRYRFRIPADVKEGEELIVRATLRWRKFNRGYTEFVFEGQTPPTLPITTVAAHEVRLVVGARSQDEFPAEPAPARAMTVHDYGIGHLLDGDTKTASEAFRLVTKLWPDRADGWRSLARALLRDGDLDAAEAALRKATELNPQDLRTAFFWGVLLEDRGGPDLQRAVEAFESVLTRYPRSRQTLDRLANAHWLLGNDREALRRALDVLAIDPEHERAHLLRMRVYQRLLAKAAPGPEADALRFAAAEAEKAFQKYKFDEDADARSLAWRERNPHDHRMSQSLIVHAEEER